jgi:hypothetical protein
MSMKSSLSDGSPMNKAHQHAAAAEELYSAGDWEGAIEEHFKAAEDFLSCLQYTNEQTACVSNIWGKTIF